jgi:hypothetical protein
MHATNMSSGCGANTHQLSYETHLRRHGGISRRRWGVVEGSVRSGRGYSVVRQFLRVGVVHTLRPSTTLQSIRRNSDRLHAELLQHLALLGDQRLSRAAQRPALVVRAARPQDDGARAQIDGGRPACATVPACSKGNADRSGLVTTASLRALVPALAYVDLAKRVKSTG